MIYMSDSKKGWDRGLFYKATEKWNGNCNPLQKKRTHETFVKIR